MTTPTQDLDMWYDRRDELREGMVFTTHAGELVKLDRRVPGDGTQWYVADWSQTSWAYYDATLEPGELFQQVEDPARLQRATLPAENTPAYPSRTRSRP